MTARKLRWLGLFGFLGLLAYPLHQPLLQVLYGFYVFLVFMGLPVDERSEANLGRAASLTYLVQLIAFMACFVVAIGYLDRADRSALVSGLTLSLAALYGLHIVTFVGGYVYFDATGR